MNIFDFFNSPDVAKHCQSINHKFNAVESATMVSRSHHQSLAKKHGAYKTIRAEYPDMELPGLYSDKPINSFHQSLAELITFEQRALKKYVSTESNAVYQAILHYEGCRRHDTSYPLELFATHEDALRDAQRIIQDDETGKNFSHLEIHKRYVGADDWIRVEITSSGKIAFIFDTFMSAHADSPLFLLDRYIDVPVPFAAGDLVEVDRGDYIGNVYVLKDICSNYAERHKKNILRANLMDMTAGVYYESSGQIFCEVMHFYPDLKYCRRELEGETRILKYISLHMQDKLCLCGLLEVQKYLSLYKQMKKSKSHFDFEWQLDQLDDCLLKS